MKKLIPTFVFLLLAGSSQARIITVDANGSAEFDNIQAAINDANDGDEVVIYDGIYTGVGNRDIDFLGKAFTLRSENGPENCIIDCQGTETEPHRGFYFHNGEGEDSVVDGFTITNGYAPEEQMGYDVQPCGGAICCKGSSPTITNCIIKNNASAMEGIGGGICCEDSTAMIQNCTIRNNWARQGGGIYAYCPVVVADCIITSNYVFGPGGRTVDGGGISCGEGATVVNCRITDNMARNGGGIRCRRPCIIRNCIFTGNRAENQGGGIGICSIWADTLIINCTLSGNHSSYGGGIDCFDCNARVINCILWDNTAAFGPEMSIVGRYRPSLLTTSYSNVVGGEGAVDVRHEVTLVWGDGNIDIDPCFANSGSWADVNDPNIVVEPNDPNAVWVDGDYHLKSQAGRWDPNSESWIQDDVTSPCIDAGNPGCPLGDEPAPNGNRRNMGAYGRTAEASKSPANWRSIADLTNDWVVDSNDLKVFVGYWLEKGECIPSDLNRSLFVDFSDFAIFGRHWSYPSAFEPGLTFNVEDCNMEGGQNQASVEDSNDTRFSVRVEGRYIHLQDLITANCCLDEIELQMTVEDGLITIFEIEHLTTPCFCICDYPTTATLGPFEPGIYLLEVIDIDGKSLGIVEVSIGEATEPGITYQIEDCNRDASVSFTAEPPDLTRFTVTVEGLYIHFEDMMTANCCPDKLELEMVVEDNLITIYETEYTLAGCRCICSFPITATLGTFEPGIYTLEVYETMGGFIGNITITIGPGE